MNTLDIQMRLLDVIELREATAIKMKNNSCEELVKRYRKLDEEMNDLIKDLAGQSQRRTVKLGGITITSGIDAKELAEAVNPYADKKEAAPEVPVQKQFDFTFDYGVLETARFVITTDKKFYENMVKNNNVVSMFTPESLIDLKTKEIHQLLQGLNLYVFRIPEDK